MGTGGYTFPPIPSFPTRRGWFGPWPWYWLGLIGVGLLSFLLLYAPFWVADHVKGHRADRDRSGSRPSGRDG